MINFDDNVNLVFYVYNLNFCNYKYIKDDLLQEGMVGLISAINGFDETRQIKFTTYAHKVIYNSMLKYIINKEQKHYLHCLSIDDIENDLVDEVEEKNEAILDLDIIKKYINENYCEDKFTKNVAILYFFKNLTQCEIAKMFLCSRNKIWRTIKKLRNDINVFIGGTNESIY